MKQHGPERFAHLTRTIAGSRRVTLRLLATGAASLTGVVAGGPAASSLARNRKRKGKCKRKGKGKGKPGNACPTCPACRASEETCGGGNDMLCCDKLHCFNGACRDTCGEVTPLGGPPARVSLSLRDPQGVSSFEVTESANTDPPNPLPSYTAGDAGPIALIFQKIDQSQPASVTVRVVNLVSDITFCSFTF